MVQSAGGPSLGRLRGLPKSDRTLVLRGPAIPISSSATTSFAPSILFAFAAGPSFAILFPLLAAAATPILAAATAADPFVSPFVSLALAIAAPAFAAAPAVPPAFAPAIASIFAGRPLAKGVPLGLF
ncbi:hypothetical protein B2J93_4954 [Marssonina coronariae]|uniref:Uncharacterized protein n=1 Tax=Diplocarpon coronariae TaxID=2795749 RepID=A0A218YX60_9HELO|nr:hypothetical protein B2J93_4954 [Marssonina coronariae]